MQPLPDVVQIGRFVSQPEALSERGMGEKRSAYLLCSQVVGDLWGDGDALSAERGEAGRRSEEGDVPIHTDQPGLKDDRIQLPPSTRLEPGVLV